MQKAARAQLRTEEKVVGQDLLHDGAHRLWGARRVCRHFPREFLVFHRLLLRKSLFFTTRTIILKNIGFDFWRQKLT